MNAPTAYLAGPYAARTELAGYAEELRTIGYRVQCQWLDETHEITAGTTGPAREITAEQVNLHASQDLIDIRNCTVLVAFTVDALKTPITVGNSGGRHVETGYALALDKDVVLVGQPENVFHRMSLVDRFADWHSALVHLARRLVEHERDLPRAAVLAEDLR